MGKSTERATKESAPQSHHASPFFKSGESRAAFFQPKLLVNAPGDHLEQEADRTADRVMAAEPPAAHAVQRKCAACEAEERILPQLEVGPVDDPLETEADVMADRVVRRQAVDMDDDERQARPVQAKPKDTVQRKCACEADHVVRRQTRDTASSQSTPAGFHTALSDANGSGAPLAPHTRDHMEEAFGADFSGVRVHTGDASAAMNEQIGARAFTYGTDIHFNDGEFAPGTERGTRLLAHELTHVVQQDAKPGNGRFIRRQICVDYPHEGCDTRPPEIVAMAPPSVLTVGGERDATLSAVEFDVVVNPSGNTPTEYQWSLTSITPKDVVQVVDIKKDVPYQASAKLKGLKQGTAAIVPELTITQKGKKAVKATGKSFTVVVIPPELEKGIGTYRKYLADYNAYTRQWTALKAREAKGEGVGEEIQKLNVEEIKQYEMARQKAEEAAKIVLDVSKKRKVHDEIGSLLQSTDLAIERIETSKTQGHLEAVELLNAEELETSDNTQAFLIALTGNLLWAFSGSLPWLAAGALAKLGRPGMRDFFKGSSAAATHVSTIVGTIGAMTAQFSAGLPSGGQRKAGLKKELLKYFGIINTHVANKQRRMSRLLLLEAMSADPPTADSDPISYVAELSVGLRYSLYGDVYQAGLNDGALPDSAKIKDYAKDQLLRQYVAGSSAVSGGAIEPTAITKLEGTNLVDQAIKALGGQKALLFGPYELVSNQLHRVGRDLGITIYDSDIEGVTAELIAGRDASVAVRGKVDKERLVNLMDALIVYVNDGGLGGDITCCAYSKEELRPVVDSILDEGIDRIWAAIGALNKLEKKGQTMYSAKRFFLGSSSSIPTDKHKHLVYKIS